MNRRQFICYSGIGMAMLGELYMWNPFAELKTVSRSEGDLENSLSRDFSEILYYASLALLK